MISSHSLNVNVGCRCSGSFHNLRVLSVPGPSTHFQPIGSDSVNDVCDESLFDKDCLSEGMGIVRDVFRNPVARTLGGGTQ
jgi:hypothetical protein